MSIDTTFMATAGSKIHRGIAVYFALDGTVLPVRLDGFFKRVLRAAGLLRRHHIAAGVAAHDAKKGELVEVLISSLEFSQPWRPM